MIVRMEPEAYREVMSLAEFANACLDGPSRSGVRAARAGMKSDPGFQIGDSPNLIEFFPSGSAWV